LTQASNKRCQGFKYMRACLPLIVFHYKRSGEEKQSNAYIALVSD